MAVLGKSVAGGISYADLFGAGLVKTIEERALAGVIGNASFMSGGIKLAVGLLARKFLGKGVLADSVALGFGVDGTEDILTALISRFGGGGGASQGW